MINNDVSNCHDCNVEEATSQFYNVMLIIKNWKGSIKDQITPDNSC